MTVQLTSPETSGRLTADARFTFGLLTDALYDEPGIVFRELVSNALDAVAKRAGLDAGAPAGRVEVVLDTDRGLLEVRDNGIGMSADEVRRYLNQIALSGTAERVRQWQDASAGTPIGQFGVGFYSAFMLAPTVELQTRSALGAEPVHWTCTREMDWRIEPGWRDEAGTTVLLELPADSPYRTRPDGIREALLRWFPFPKVPLEFRLDDAAPEAIGDVDPVWRRRETATTEEINRFYRDYFGEALDPLYWVPLASPDLGLRGMVFFRDTRCGAEAIDGRVEIFSRGVHVGTDLRMLVPKFANLQHAVIECDRLPLVVSRGQVRSGGEDDVSGLVFETLSQELAIAAHDLFTNHRPRYEELWPELAPFVKYGVLTDRVFASVMTRRTLFAELGGDLLTLGEYLDRVQKSRPGTVFYASDPVGQAGYVEAFRAAGVPALLLDHVIDQPLLQRLEAVTKDVRFVRVDADVAGVLAVPLDAADEPLAGRLAGIFAPVLDAVLPGATVEPMRLRVAELPVALVADETSRRMNDLAEVSGLMAGRTPDAELAVRRTLVINLANPMVRDVAEAAPDAAALAARQLLDLTLIGQDRLDPDQLLGFLARSQQILAGYLASTTEEGRRG